MAQHALDHLHRSLGTTCPRPLSVEHIHWGKMVVVRGPISMHTSETVRSILCEAIHGGDGDLSVQLTEAEVWDTTGLGVLVGAHDRARRCGRRLVVTDPSREVQRMLRVTRLHRVLPIETQRRHVAA